MSILKINVLIIKGGRTRWHPSIWLFLVWQLINTLLFHLHISHDVFGSAVGAKHFDEHSNFPDPYPPHHIDCMKQDEWYGWHGDFIRVNKLKIVWKKMKQNKNAPLTSSWLNFCHYTANMRYIPTKTIGILCWILCGFRRV